MEGLDADAFPSPVVRTAVAGTLSDDMPGAFQWILVPVAFDSSARGEPGWTPGEDGAASISATTRDALVLAAKLAEGGHVRLMHVTPDFASASAYVGTSEGTGKRTIVKLNETARDKSEAVLRDLASRHCPGVDVTTCAVPSPILPAILHEAKHNPPDAIVLAASGHGRVRRFVLGSTADKIIRNAPCPVVVVPVRGEPGEPDETD